MKQAWKVSYSHPVSTSILYTTGLIGTYLYLNGRYALHFFTVASLRAGDLSEMLRADYRGRGKITAIVHVSDWDFYWQQVFRHILPIRRILPKTSGT